MREVGGEGCGVTFSPRGIMGEKKQGKVIKKGREEGKGMRGKGKRLRGCVVYGLLLSVDDEVRQGRVLLYLDWGEGEVVVVVVAE